MDRAHRKGTCLSAKEFTCSVAACVPCLVALLGVQVCVLVCSASCSLFPVLVCTVAPVRKQSSFCTRGLNSRVPRPARPPSRWGVSAFARALMCGLRFWHMCMPFSESAAAYVMLRHATMYSHSRGRRVLLHCCAFDVIRQFNPVRLTWPRVCRASARARGLSPSCVRQHVDTVSY